MVQGMLALFLGDIKANHPYSEATLEDDDFGLNVAWEGRN